MLARARIAANARIPLLDREGSEATNLDPVTPCERLNDLVQNSVHHILGIPLIELRVVVGNLLDQFRLDHPSPPSRGSLER